MMQLTPRTVNKLAALLLLLPLLMAAHPTATAQSTPDFLMLIEVDDVLPHIIVLADTIGARLVGSEAEAQAAAYIAAQFEMWGYEVEIQDFETHSPLQPEGENPVASRNVVAMRRALEEETGMIVIGAHMDSADEGQGATDNASGIAAMLAAAEALAAYDPTQTVVFVAFGAEEYGSPSGAETFVELLGDEIETVIAMINIDSVGIGTDLNVYAGAVIIGEQDDGSSEFEGGPVWVRDLALDLAWEMDLPFTTTPPDSWDGFTGAWSDHYAFVMEGVPIAYFEAWQWTNTDNPWWGQETPEGDYLHTKDDVVAYVVPEKVEMVAEVVAAMVYEMALSPEYIQNMDD